MSGPPLSDGAVLIDRHGRITAVGPAAAVPTPAGVRRLEFPDGVLLPGLINAHTHLELTGLRGAVEEEDFADWIGQLRALKETRTPADFLAAARAGVRACWAAGVTTVADTGDSGAALRALAETGGSGIAYQEVFGPHPEQCAGSLARLEECVAATAPLQTERARLGVSPHAPYSVSGALYRAVGALAHERGWPLAVHIAESPAESALLRDFSGPFADAWRGRGIPAPDPLGDSPLAWLARAGLLGPGLLAIHAVQVSEHDVSLLADHRVAVAHCPRSNTRHGHGAAPLAALLARGVPVALGTDSEVSLLPDLFAEVRAARRLGGLASERALRLCTIEAAAALGLSGEVGALAPGLWGDVAVLALPDGADGGMLLDAVAEAAVGDIRATVLAGRVVYRRS